MSQPFYRIDSSQRNPLWTIDDTKLELIDQIKSQKKQKDLSHIQKLIRLPGLRKLKPQESPFPKPQDSLRNATSLSQNLKKSAIDLRQNLRNEFQAYQVPENFQFFLPESIFPLVPQGQNCMISYQQPNIYEPENTYRDSLSPQQIDQIRETGQFKVKSSREWVKIPYVWKINECLFKGIKNVQRDWNDRLAVIHSLFYECKEMLVENLPEELLNIVKWPWRMFALFFGEKGMRTSYSVDYERQVAKDFWNQVMTKYYVNCKQWGSDLWKYMDAKFTADPFMPFQNLTKEQENLRQLDRQAYNKRKEETNNKITEINHCSSKFDQYWNKLSKKLFVQISESVQKAFEMNRNNAHENQESRRKEKQTRILEKFNLEEYTYYTTFLSKELTQSKVPSNVIEAIMTVLTLINVTMLKQDKFNKRRNQEHQRIRRKLIQDHPSASGTAEWFNRKLDQEFGKREVILRDEFYSQFIDQDLRKRLSQKQFQVYQLWFQYLKKHDTMLQEKKRLKQDLEQPVRTFWSSYHMLPPYPVNRQQNPVRYSIVKTKQLKMTTAYHCWKFRLYCMRLRAWTMNWISIMVFSCWYGPLGLRCLCGIQDFCYDYDVDQLTGQLKENQYSTRKTVLGHFSSVLDGITQSRQSFQGQPDTGLFGKTCSRICNLLECYVFRFFIVGILIVLTLYPVAILIGSIVSLLLLITFWIWVPLALAFTYLFNVFIYNNEGNTQGDYCLDSIFPVLNLIVRLVIAIFKTIFYILTFFVFMPIISLFIFIYSCIFRCLRSLTDCFMLCFIRCCARTPSTDSALASKISGPDMSRSFYMSIHEQDVYILIRAELEKIYLSKVEQVTRKNIQSPIKRLQEAVKLIIQPLLLKDSDNYSGYGSNSVNTYNNKIRKSVDEVSNKFNRQIDRFRKRYPIYPTNTRFTQMQLSTYFPKSQNVVKDYVEKNILSKWIFIELNVDENDYEELTKKIWIRVFQCGESIFQPLEQIDQRFKLEDIWEINRNSYYGSSNVSYKDMRDNVSKISKAIEGSVKLGPQLIPKVKPLNNSLLSRKIPIYKTQNLFQIMNMNFDRSIYLNRSLPYAIFSPHLSITELIRLQDAEYINARQENERSRKDW